MNSNTNNLIDTTAGGIAADTSGWTGYVRVDAGTWSTTSISVDVGDLTATTSAIWATKISNETGTGLMVFGTDPTLLGTSTINAITIGGDNINEFAGTGLSVTTGTLNWTAQLSDLSDIGVTTATR